MLRVVTDDDAGAEMRGALDEIVLDGARRMLAAALEAEADEYIARLAGELDERGRRLVVRNGHAEAAHDHHCGRPDRGDRSQDQRQARRRGPAIGAGSAARSCRRGPASPRRSPRFCRSCTCTA